jgi:hypothetical protein
VNAETSSPDVVENTRKTGALIESEILRRLADTTQEHAADCMGVSPSTVSRMRDDITKVAQLMAAIGLQVAPSDALVYSSKEIDALEHMAYKYLQSRLEKDRMRG